jgi:O-antigen/teichoic acid export membrane protein
VVLDFLFGSRYIGAAVALQILSLGFFVHASLGPNSGILLTMGKTKLLMWIVLVGSIINIILNAVLIPPLGIMGAALASALALITIKIFTTIKVYQLSKIHPFTKNYLKPIIISVTLIFLITIIVRNLFTITFWMPPIFLVMFLVAYGLSLLLTKSFDHEDIMMLLTIEQRTGIDATAIKRILRRFL